ncbi:MAG: c-type cytochrome domain-containing protein, partial [Pirellulaceae bacterium]|nr:c-type cytochrome domain-containing protein [Pirellulaceae bacterium]
MNTLSPRNRVSCWLVLPVVVLLLLVAPDVTLPADEKIDFFENKIRPVLVKHCYQCHSTKAKAVKGDLLLDSKAGMLKGGDSGPAIVVGEPAESNLIKALKYDGYEMPP